MLETNVGFSALAVVLRIRSEQRPPSDGISICRYSGFRVVAVQKLHLRYEIEPLSEIIP